MVGHCTKVICCSTQKAIIGAANENMVSVSFTEGLKIEQQHTGGNCLMVGHCKKVICCPTQKAIIGAANQKVVCASFAETLIIKMFK